MDDNLTWKELWQLIRGALGAALLIAGAFILGFLLIIALLCLPAWL